MTKDELANILKAHVLWLANAPTGSRADLSQADLSRANLSQANLSRANLSWANLSWANLSRANLSWADLSRANLSQANLSWADLSQANLSQADLSQANLSQADLSQADLSQANLSQANLKDTILDGINWLAYIGIVPTGGRAKAFKLTNSKNEGIYKGGITYGVGMTVAAKLDPDVNVPCSTGINLATFAWCLNALREAGEKPHLYLVEFSADPKNVCVPIGSDGKFRVGRAKVIAECDFKGNPTDMGL